MRREDKERITKERIAAALRNADALAAAKPKFRYCVCPGCGIEGNYNACCAYCNLKRLRWKERAAITLRVQGKTFKEIGGVFGISTERARQIVCGGERNIFSVTVYGERIPSGGREVRGKERRENAL